MKNFVTFSAITLHRLIAIHVFRNYRITTRIINVVRKCAYSPVLKYARVIFRIQIRHFTKIARCFFLAGRQTARVLVSCFCCNNVAMLTSDCRCTIAVISIWLMFGCSCFFTSIARGITSVVVAMVAFFIFTTSEC